MEQPLNEYLLDVKVYEPAHRQEIPFDLPHSSYDNEGHLKLGYRSWDVYMTESKYDEFVEWALDTPILKLLGTTDLAVSTKLPYDEPNPAELDLPLREDTPDQER
jgi:hypothetical protein